MTDAGERRWSLALKSRLVRASCWVWCHRMSYTPHYVGRDGADGTPSTIGRHFRFTRRDTLLDRYTSARVCSLSKLKGSCPLFVTILSYRRLLSTIFVHFHRHASNPKAISVPNGTFVSRPTLPPRRPSALAAHPADIRSKRGQSERRANEGDVGGRIGRKRRRLLCEC